MTILTRWVALLLLIAIANQGYAQSNRDSVISQVAKCAIIRGELSRLECYDELAESHNLDGPQEVEADLKNVGEWNVSVQVNPIDDSRTVSLILMSSSGKSSMLGQPIGLILRCRSGETELYINWRDYLGPEARVLTRIGNEDAKTQLWGLSTDSQATFYPGNDTQFIKMLLNADRLVAQVTPYSESPVTAIFDIVGLTSAVLPLRDECNW